MAIGVASLQKLPGYLDSDYYFAGGMQLVKGAGFTEPYLWNYLDDPAGLPHPSHSYWFPLASILAAAGMYLFGVQTYAAGRIGFILIAAAIPPLTTKLALDVTKRRSLALTSGLLAVFSIYHAPFLPVTDNFGPYILFGLLIFLLVKKDGWWVYLLLGLLAGLMNLARSDGLLWLGLLGLLPFMSLIDSNQRTSVRLQHLLKRTSLLIAGYFLVMMPWYARNIAEFGSPMSPGNGRLIWLTNYNQTFAYPADQINMEHWLAEGWENAITVRIRSLRFNTLNAFAAQGGIILFPFILVGLWHMRKDVRVKLSATGWLILIFVMTLVFPFAGARGGFFHAGAAFQSFWWAVAPIGLERTIVFIRHRGLLNDSAYSIFRVALVIICAVLTGIIIWIRIIQPGWQPEEELYIKVEQFLVAQGATPDEIAIVRNPPGYYLVSGRSTIVMPPGDPGTVLALAKRYNASYFILEPNGILKEYQELYDQKRKYPGLEIFGEVDGARIFSIHTAE